MSMHFKASTFKQASPPDDEDRCGGGGGGGGSAEATLAICRWAFQ